MRGSPIIGDFTITELSNSGAVLSGASGYFLGGQVHPISIAIDASDNAWFINAFGNAVFELNSSGSLLSPVAGWPSCVSPVPADSAGPKMQHELCVSDDAGWLREHLDRDGQ